MKNYKLNPDAEKVELVIDGVDMTILETEGWDFDFYYSNYEKAHKDMDYETAKQKVQTTSDITLFIRKESVGDTVEVREALRDYDSNETYDSNDSGDAEQSIKDIIALLDSGRITIDEQQDLSTNSEGEYVPTFVLT